MVTKTPMEVVYERLSRMGKISKVGIGLATVLVI